MDEFNERYEELKDKYRARGNKICQLNAENIQLKREIVRLEEMLAEKYNITDDLVKANKKIVNMQNRLSNKDYIIKILKEKKYAN